MSKETEILQENSQDQTVESSDMQQGVLEDVFNLKSDNPFINEEQVTPENVLENAPESALDNNNQQDDTQYQYWQSQHDKKQAELDALKTQYADMDDIIPIARHIKRNPEVLNNLSKETNTEAPLPELVKPERPVKPGNFSRSEAMADPDSLSAKYLDSQDDYVSSMSEYMLEKETRRETISRQMEQKQMAFNKQQETLGALTSKFGYTPELANDFMDTMSSPESLSLDNLVKLHKLNIGMSTKEGNQVSPQAQQKQKTMQSRAPKLSIPKPIGVQPGQSVQSSTKSTENNMMDNMINSHKKQNPFQN